MVNKFLVGDLDEGSAFIYLGCFYQVIGKGLKFKCFNDWVLCERIYLEDATHRNVLFYFDPLTPVYKFGSI